MLLLSSYICYHICSFILVLIKMTGFFYIVQISKFILYCLIHSICFYLGIYKSCLVFARKFFDYPINRSF